MSITCLSDSTHNYWHIGTHFCPQLNSSSHAEAEHPSHIRTIHGALRAGEQFCMWTFFFSSPQSPLNVGRLFQTNPETFKNCGKPRWVDTASQLKCIFGDVTFSWRKFQVHYYVNNNYVPCPETINAYMYDYLHWVLVFRQFFHRISTT